MRGVVCTWAAKLAQSAEQTFEDKYIPTLTGKLSEHTLHCELVEIGLDEEVERDTEREAPWKWFTLFEIADAEVATAATYDDSNLVPMLDGFEHARFDVRSYEEVQRWQQADWNGGMEFCDSTCRVASFEADDQVDHTDVASVAVMEWTVEEGKEKEVLDFYRSEAAPTIASSPDTLRFRFFKITNGIMLKAGSTEKLEREKMHTYLTLVELECEEWPWDQVVALGEKPQWREYFEEKKGVKWQSSHYLVKRSYPEHDDEE